VAAKGDPFPFIPAINNWVVGLEANRYLHATGDNGRDSWLWLLEPVNDRQTRLIWRVRWKYDWTKPGIGLQLASDLGDFVFQRNILLGIKERSEGLPLGSLAAGTPDFVLWLLSFVSFLVSLGALVVRRDWLRPLLAVAATFGGTLRLVFRMPPLRVNVTAVALLYGGLWALLRTGGRGGSANAGSRLGRICRMLPRPAFRRLKE
jgi:hypothetical protein